MKENDKNYNIKKSRSVLKIVIAIILTAIITYFCTISITLKSYLKQSGITYMSTKMGLIKQKLEKESIYDLDENEMIESALKGYVQGLDDKYTQYLTIDEMKDLVANTTGTYVGIGIYMINNIADNTVVIVGVIEGSVAENAGLKSGDIIKKVNGIEYTGEQLDSVSSKIKEKEGVNVELTITRNSEEKIFNIVTSNIKIKTVSSKMLENNIAYIEINSFNDGTAEEFKSAYGELSKNNPTGLIIDLRNNGGGLVNESLAIAETMIEKDKIMLITANKEEKETVEKSKENPIIKIPVTILINKNTASASEILAGALKDDCNYKIIGTTSYGKGVIQTIYSFTDGSGLKVTTEEYFTPNHNKINSVGIVPDIEIKLDSEWENISNVPYENDLQLKEAIKQLKK